MNEFKSDPGLSDDQLRYELTELSPSSPYPAEEIEARIQRTIGARLHAYETAPGLNSNYWPGSREERAPWRRGLLMGVTAAAASIAFFVAGMEYGRRLVAPSSTAGAFVPAQELSLPLMIQSAGTQYVASLSQFSNEASQLNDDERQVAREVALAILYGATLELIRADGSDAVLQTVADMVGDKRYQVGTEANQTQF